MVNSICSSRTALLELLRNADGPVSGTVLGSRLGISRVAVRKHIIKLIDEGFFIETAKNGYRLRAEPDFPAPSDFDARQVHIHDEVESTMDEALRSTDKGFEDVQFYLARAQRAGRGRNRRTWISPDGGLYLTAVFRPSLPAAYISLYVIQTGLFLSDALRDLYSVDCSFRWPNDLYVGNSKLGGLLLELSGPSEDPDRAFLGIGLNVCSEPGISSTGKPGVTSLKEELYGKTDRTPGTKELFTAIKPGLESSLVTIEPESVRKRWRNRTSAIGTRMNIDGILYTVRDLALNGSLLLSDANGIVYETVPGPRIMGRV